MTRHRCALLSTFLCLALGVALWATPAAAGTTDAAAIAEAGTLVGTDLASGLRIMPSGDDEADDRQNQKLAAKTKGCKQYLALSKAFDKTTDSKSDDFTNGFLELGNHAYVFANERAATQAFKLATVPSTAACLTALFEKGFAKGVAADPQIKAQVEDYRVKIEDVPSVADTVGDESVGYSGGFEVNLTDGSNQQLLVSTFLTRVGPAILTYTFQVDNGYLEGNPTATDYLDQAIEATVTRTQAAVG
jgi:hypothetical protein